MEKDKLNTSMSIFTTEIKNQNRKRVSEPNNKLSKEFEMYFLDFMDKNWNISVGDDTLVSYIYISKTLHEGNDIDNYIENKLESEFDNVVMIMSEIRDRLTDEGLQSKFLIFLNGRVQQDLNPDDLSLPIYKYKGVDSSSNSRHYRKNKVYAKIQFVII